jgi:hypothetical protein
MPSSFFGANGLQSIGTLSFKRPAFKRHRRASETSTRGIERLLAQILSYERQQTSDIGVVWF